MQKKYFLLRQNIESGPFSVGELMQQSVAPADLVWVEGESLAWKKAAQIEELQPGYDASKNNKKIISRATAIHRKRPDAIERKADEIRRKAMAYQPFTYQQPKEKVTPIHYSAHAFAGEDIDLVFHHNEKQINFNQVASVFTVTLMALGGLYLGSKSFFKQQPIVHSEAAQIIHVPDAINAAATPAAPAMAVNEPLPDTMLLQQPQVVTAAYPLAKKARASMPQKEMVVNETEALPPTEKPALPAVNSTVLTEKKEEPKIVVQQTTKEEAPPKTEDLAASDKKKSLGQAIKGLFRKKHRDEEKQSTEETTAAQQ